MEVIPALRRAIHPWRDGVSYRRIKQVLREFRPDVVHTHSAKAGVLGRAAASALHVPAIVHTVHGAPFYPYQSVVTRTFYRACERWAARRCSAFISVADAMTDLMVEAGVAPRDKFTTIYSGMEVEPLLSAAARRDEVRGRLGFAPEHVVVGKIARLFHLKGHADVIRAAAEVVGVRPDVRFLFIGDGILRERLQEQARAAGLERHIRWTGLVPPTEIPELVAAMDILVHASLREGLARALPQALIVGRPVVSYDVDGAREVVLTDATGILVPPQDVAALAAAMTRLAADPALRERLGREGRTRFADRFRHQRMTADIRALYERLLAANTSPTRQRG